MYFLPHIKNNDLEIKFCITIIVFIGARFLYSSLTIQKQFQIFEWNMQNMYPYIDNPQVDEELLTIICCLPLIYSFFTILFINFSCRFLTFSEVFKNKVVNSIIENTIFDLFFMYQCFAVTMFFTQIIKIEVGMPRPNFFQMCNYQQINNNYTFYTENTHQYQIVNIDNCYTSISEINDSISSFPSGHTSYCFSLATSIFLLIPFKKLPFYNIFWFTPFIISSYVGISRIQDYYHNVWDVIAGALLGIFIPYIIFEMYKINIKKRYLDFMTFEEINNQIYQNV